MLEITFEIWLVMALLIEPVSKMRCDCPGKNGHILHSLSSRWYHISHNLEILSVWNSRVAYERDSNKTLVDGGDAGCPDHRLRPALYFH